MPCSRAVRLLFVTGLTLALSACQSRSSSPVRPEGTAVVVRVVDGDTLVVDLNGSNVRVRLLGLDTPETVDENRPIQCFGHEASGYLAQLVPPGSAVRLERDVEARDRFDRLLVYLYRVDDGLFVNAALIEGGYATTLSIAPNTMRARDFEVLRLQAQRDKRGLWGACPSFGSAIDPTTAPPRAR